MKRVLKLMPNEDTVEVKVEEFIESRMLRGCCEKTCKGYRKFFHTLLDPNKLIDEVDWQGLILNIRGMELSPASINTYLRTIKVFMKWLGITEGLPVLRKVETVKTLYTLEELQALLRKPNSRCTFAEFRTWCIILLVYDTGMRAGSLRNILIKDIDLENNVVMLRHTKTRKVQLLPFSDTTKNAIKKMLRARGDYSEDDYLFTSVYNNKFTENGLAEAVAIYNRSRGVAKTSIHLLRHNFARAWVLDGNDAFSLQKMLGHSSLDMSRHYCQLYDNDIIVKYKSPVEALSKKAFKM